MNIAFGFILYKMETDKFEQFFVIDHVARDPTDKVVINQIPNVWTIRNEEDKDLVIRDTFLICSEINRMQSNTIF